MKNSFLRIKGDAIIDSLLFIYLISINIRLINDQASAVIQNICYVGLLLLSLFKLARNFRFATFDILFLFFYSFACLSLFWTSSTENSIYILRIIGKVFVLCIFLPKIYFKKNESRKRLLKILIYSYIAVLFYLLVDLFLFKGVNQLSYLGEAFGLDSVRLTVRAALCGSIAYYFFRTENKKYYVCIELFLFVVSVLTGKRTGLIFFAVFFVLFEFVTNRNSLSKKAKVFLAGVVASVAFLIAVFNVDILYNSIGIRIEMAISTVLYHTQVDKSTIERRILLDNALYLFRLHPVRGNGINAVRTYLRYVDFYHVTYSHNNFVELLAGVGIVGMVLYYSTYLLGFWSYAELMKKSTDIDIGFSTLCFSVLLSFFICDFFEVTYESYYEIFVLAVFIDFLSESVHEMKCQLSESDRSGE